MENKKVHSLINKFPGKRVLIIGDIMLDEYIYGDIRRISPEAPVPVVEIQRCTFAPGGAANAAMNIVELGGVALLCGVVGDDSQANKLRGIINLKRNLNINFLIDGQRPTTTKTRIIAHDQQVVRMDSESNSLIEKALEEEILAWINSSIEKVDVCLLSDYDKGVLTSTLTSKVIDIARAAKKPIVVDPKSPDFNKYRYATIVTPNLNEATRAINGNRYGEKNLMEIGRQLQNILKGSALLITRGCEGMTLFSNETMSHIPALTQKVYDVTGAGDTVVSVLALALASGAELNEAAFLANVAASIVVGKVGTATVSQNEIIQRMKQ